MSKHRTEHQSGNIIFTIESGGTTHNEDNTAWPQATGDSNPNLHDMKRKMSQQHLITASLSQIVSRQCIRRAEKIMETLRSELQ